MSKDFVLSVNPDGPHVTVTPKVNLYGPKKVGLIAQPEDGRGWVELSPAQARALATALERAAEATEQGNEAER